MPDDAPTKVTAADVAPNRRRGGDIRVLLSPRTVGATSGFLGVVTLRPGEAVSAHIHPYSEEFMYVVSGAVVATVAGAEVTVAAGEAFMVPKETEHRLRNAGDEVAFAVFHLSPLAPRPELGHVDTEQPAEPSQASPAVGQPR